jgi:hypothetical protein
LINVSLEGVVLVGELFFQLVNLADQLLLANFSRTDEGRVGTKKE